MTWQEEVAPHVLFGVGAHHLRLIPVLQEIQDRQYVREVWADNDGFVHVVSEDGPTLRKSILNVVVQRGLDLQHLSEEQVDLQSIYRKTMGMEKE